MTREVTLLGMWASPLAMRIEWALKCKGISYEYVDEDLDCKSQRLLTYNPVHKQIPVLLHGGKPIAESLIILEYIDETWSQNALLLPRDPYERSMARFWAKFGDEKGKQTLCYTAMRRLFASKEEDVESAKKETMECLKTIDDVLKGSKFFGGDKAGFLDVAFGWIAHWTPLVEDALGLSLVDEGSMPGLKAWFNAFIEVPWVKECLPPEQKLRSHLGALREKLLMSNYSKSTM